MPPPGANPGELTSKEAAAAAAGRGQWGVPQGARVKRRVSLPARSPCARMQISDGGERTRRSHRYVPRLPPSTSRFKVRLAALRRRESNVDCEHLSGAASCARVSDSPPFQDLSEHINLFLLNALKRERRRPLWNR